MSVRIMSAIFEIELADLPYQKGGKKRKAKASTCKLLLLAIADHANDEGESAYPGYVRLKRKTALSPQGIADTLDALKQNNMIAVGAEPSKIGTNNYAINMDALIKADSSHLSKDTQATRQGRLKPLEHNHPLTTIKPERDSIATKLAELQGGGLNSMDAQRISEWKASHTDEWITKAIQTAKDAGARSSAYVDRILIGWEANGYPKTREQLISERRASRPAPKETTSEMIDRVLGGING